jgi:hypothetical protein
MRLCVYVCIDNPPAPRPRPLCVHDLLYLYYHAGETPLHRAAGNGQYMIVRLLVNAGADVDVPEGLQKCTPLHRCVKSGNLPTVKYLITEVSCWQNASI